MQTSRRSLLAAGAGLASVPMTQAADGPAAHAPPPLEYLILVSLEANAALMRGDVDTYRALIPVGGDFTLMSPFGGKPSHASGITEEVWQSMKTFFREGSLTQEVVQAYSSADMVVLATIERAHVGVGDLPLQDWALRVTLVYRREGDDWLLVHRHADPLVAGISVEQAARLAHGGNG